MKRCELEWFEHLLKAPLHQLAQQLHAIDETIGCENVGILLGEAHAVLSLTLHVLLGTCPLFHGNLQVSVDTSNMT